jgi:hypothetical protein
MSVPFFGKRFTFTQPDGTQLDVRGWGDQHHAVFQTLDGFTVTQDPVSGFYEYATVSGDREDLKPSGIRPGARDPVAFGLSPGARISRTAAAAKAMERSGMAPGRSRWEIRRSDAKNALRMADPGIAFAPPSRQTVGAYVGFVHPRRVPGRCRHHRS